ncbi:MAG: L-threonylcarbamoyladenylate synthase [Peptococcaceae bacterium]|nr:L-threonylcarbamoyladenylate synthase [Peptococcaceae bacterium]
MDDKVKTHYIKVDPWQPAETDIAQCGEIIRAGGLVAFPTETVYGLGANALDREACRRIFQAKGRPQDNPLIVHIADAQDVQMLTRSGSTLAALCIDRFWPGPLTLVLPKAAQIPLEVTAGLDTVAIRMPDHPVALALIKQAGVPIAAPSANLSGRPSPTLAEHVREDLGGRIDAIIDGGACRIGLESTVLDLTEAVPIILRPGGVSREALEAILGKVNLDPGITDAGMKPRSPGVKYQHYAPRGQVILVEGERRLVQVRIETELCKAREQGLKVGILSSEESAACYKQLKPDYLAVLGAKQEPGQVAAKLYHTLRSCDHNNIDLILAETFATSGMGAAVMNRMEKAAGYHRIVEI